MSKFRILHVQVTPDALTFSGPCCYYLLVSRRFNIAQQRTFKG